ncbi:5'-nucleotidase, lipoprotein e(P4) family [Empedobacter brevis]|uniref:5'-nucleotidase, lipoprotein e(P4) family n=1 Tax=Empedobacter brevis TaxID=247 RepID=A0AAJ1V6J9_9FLAO|nr:5'-nucleotidase, lipoprotein e(P4) family [Empedobacter brevis]MDM1071706.1 5'-nucleotidase, lipoprotein e(P4) family [Empedobacter brevis]QES94088.1 5'-nucleotidase, lipoprotein e(P4) family [Empedobacter brevis]QHC85910.1 5'-nucleotidase [Empedobacter brevis]
MKHLQLMLGSVMLFGLTACQTPKVATQEQQQKTAAHSLQVDGKIYAAFFQQRAAEYQALSQQAYNVAKLRLDEAIANKGSKPLAIVTDIDETFLDNSYYAVEMAKQGKTWSQDSWANWTSKGVATPLAGSLEFFQYAASKGIQIFYITNRYEVERAGTLANLEKYNYPLQSPQNLILRSKESSKEARRQNVAKDYDIVLLLGDSLTDFSTLFDNHKSEKERAAAVETLKAEFGKRFIVLPNVGYGDWESALFNYKYDLTQEQKDSMIYEAVKEMPSN